MKNEKIFIKDWNSESFSGIVIIYTVNSRFKEKLLNLKLTFELYFHGRLGLEIFAGTVKVQKWTKHLMCP